MAEGPDYKIFPIGVQPGIRRDGTSLQTTMFRDGRWTRWHLGSARKMGGCRTITNQLLGTGYALNVYPLNNVGWTHIGSSEGVQQIQLNGNTGLGASLVTRATPGYVADDDNLWQFATTYDDAVGTTSVQLLAFVAPNLSAIDSSTTGTLYIGEVTDTGALSVAGGAPNVAGGVCVIPPYTFLYDDAGGINWSDANTLDFSTGDAGADRITDKKIVYGTPTRGSNVPSGIFISLDSLIRATYVGDTAVWSFNIVADEISILSSRCVGKYDGVVYWAGTNRFYFYDGVVRELPNAYNLDFFYENINYNQRQKCFTRIDQRFGEIWFCFPYGTATECNWAVIYNVRGQYWYDTELLDGRAASFTSSTFRWPVMTDWDTSLYLHEFGYDSIDSLSVIEPIEAYYETSAIALPAFGPIKGDGWTGDDAWMKLLRIEPDWVSQSGPMTLVLKAQPYAMSDEADPADDVKEQTLEFSEGQTDRPFKFTGRLVSYKWISNVQGGSFQQGVHLVHIGPDDRRGN